MHLEYTHVNIHLLLAFVGPAVVLCGRGISVSRTAGKTAHHLLAEHEWLLLQCF